jgi:hypothetical protein
VAAAIDSTNTSRHLSIQSTLYATLFAARACENSCLLRDLPKLTWLKTRPDDRCEYTPPAISCIATTWLNRHESPTETAEDPSILQILQVASEGEEILRNVAQFAAETERRSRMTPEENVAENGLRLRRRLESEKFPNFSSCLWRFRR